MAALVTNTRTERQTLYFWHENTFTINIVTWFCCFTNAIHLAVPKLLAKMNEEMKYDPPCSSHHLKTSLRTWLKVHNVTGYLLIVGNGGYIVKQWRHIRMVLVNTYFNATNMEFTA